MEQIISKEEKERIDKIKGEIRGLALKIFKDFVTKKKGKEAIEELEEKMRKAGYPINFKKVKAMDYYPIKYMAVIFIFIKKFLHWKPEDFYEFGVFRAKSSLYIRLFLRYIASLERVVKNAPEMWKKISTSGELEVVEFNKNKKYAVFRIKNFYDWSPEQSPFFLGLFSGLTEVMLGQKTTCEETKCTFKGDEYHEFLLKW